MKRAARARHCGDPAYGQLTIYEHSKVLRGPDVSGRRASVSRWRVDRRELRAEARRQRGGGGAVSFYRIVLIVMPCDGHGG